MRNCPEQRNSFFSLHFLQYLNTGGSTRHCISHTIFFIHRFLLQVNSNIALWGTQPNTLLRKKYEPGWFFNHTGSWLFTMFFFQLPDDPLNTFQRQKIFIGQRLHSLSGKIFRIYLLVSVIQLLTGCGGLSPAFLLSEALGIYINSPSTYSCTFRSSSSGRTCAAFL